MISICEHVPLRDMTTFRIGGPARYFCVVKNEDELVEAMKFVFEKKISFFILGCGSNILVGDVGFDGLVIKMEMQGIAYVESGVESTTGSSTTGVTRVVVGAGENWDEFVGTCVDRRLYGLENLSGIPGTVGAAPVQNIGAYGIEVAKAIESVRVFDTSTRIFLDIPNADCHFKYRDSIFKHEKNLDGLARYVIVSVTFLLKKDSTIQADYKDLREYSKKILTPKDLRDAVLAIRAAKLPDIRTVGTAGSFFKNPSIPEADFKRLKGQYPDMPGFPDLLSSIVGQGLVKVSLGWILEHVCGYKGTTKGRVGTYKNQALVLVNHFSNEANLTGNLTGATAQELKTFAADIITMVKEKTGIDIEPEVQYI